MCSRSFEASSLQAAHKMAYKRSRPGGALSIDVMDDSKVDESYDADAEVFEKGELAIDSEGFSMGTRRAAAPRHAARRA